MKDITFDTKRTNMGQLCHILFVVVQYGNELREAIEQNKMQRSKDAGKIKRETNINETKRHSESHSEAVKFQQAKNNVL